MPTERHGPCSRVWVARSVQILVEFIAIHVPQEFHLAQLIQSVKAGVLGRWGELAQVGVEVGVERVVGGRGVIGRRRGAGGYSGHHRDAWGLAEGQGAQRVTAVERAGGILR